MIEWKKDGHGGWIGTYTVTLNLSEEQLRVLKSEFPDVKFTSTPIKMNYGKLDGLTLTEKEEDA